MTALLDRGVLDESRLEEANRFAKQHGQGLLETLVDTGAVGRRDLLQVAAAANPTGAGSTGACAGKPLAAF